SRRRAEAGQKLAVDDLERRRAALHFGGLVEREAEAAEIPQLEIDVGRMDEAKRLDDAGPLLLVCLEVLPSRTRPLQRLQGIRGIEGLDVLRPVEQHLERPLEFPFGQEDGREE